MNTRDLLQANCERLSEQYSSNLEGVLTLQSTLIRDILPSVTDELELDPDATDWAKEWLEDVFSLFRIFRRNNFTRSFAMESIRKNLVWRLSNLWPLAPPSRTPVLHCLPSDVRDPFGRPIIILETVAMGEISNVSKPLIIQAIEGLRAHLKRLNDLESRPPILQYIVLLDLKGFSFKNFNIDLITWTLREIFPRFPGMLAGVFMLNYSWAHAGMWNVIKRILPVSALSRVFFPSQEELIYYFTPSALPEDYGGSLPSLAHLDDPLRAHEILLLSPVTPNGQVQLPYSPSPSSPYLPTFSMITSLSPTSLLNPFFGYPVSSVRGSLSLHHGRRRKRDLVRTLAFLFWIRWRRYITVGILVAIFAFAVKLGKRRGIYRFPRYALALKTLLSTRPN